MDHGGKYSTPSQSKDVKQVEQLEQFFDIEILEDYFKSKCVQIDDKSNELVLNFTIFKSETEEKSVSDVEEVPSDGELQNKDGIWKKKSETKGE